MLLSYTLFRLSPRLERRIRFACIALAPPVLIPPMAGEVNAKAAEWIAFSNWFDRGAQYAAFGGPYLMLTGLFLVLAGLWIGNEVLEYRTDNAYEDTYRRGSGQFVPDHRSRYHPVGMVMVISQTGGVLTFAAGVIFTAAHLLK